MNEELNQDVAEEINDTVNETPILDENTAQEPNTTLEDNKNYITEDRLQELLKEARQEAVDEALKLSKMSEEERQKHDEKEKERLLQEREAAIALKELRLEAENLLLQENISKSMTGFVMGKDLEDTKARVKLFKEEFDKAVQSQVEKRLKGRIPNQGNGTQTASLQRQIEELMGVI